MSYGKFIVLCGINNLGKTLQAKRLVRILTGLGIQTTYLKYPIYGLEPTGSMIDEYLRGGNPFNINFREIQLIYTQNRLQYQSNLIETLSSGTWVVAEDYVSTGIAWGGEKNILFLERLNSSLLREDITILFDGKRFSDGIENDHKHEGDQDLIDATRNIFHFLAQTYSWPIVDANKRVDEVQSDVWSIISQEFNI